jgi:FlaA1/EpsC-like NDP-sugar epimerase
MNPLSKLVNWYFSKRALPYWCVLIFDCAIVVFSGLVCYSVDRGLVDTAHKFFPLLGTLCFYLIFYVIGFRVMKTYQGVMRYSSFVDLYRIGIAMLMGAVTIGILRQFFHFDQWFVPIRMRELTFTFVIATLLMCMARVLVKHLFDTVFSSDATKPVFIYGVKKGGIGLAKNISNEEPQRFALKGFISDTTDLPGRTLMGVHVYKNDENLIRNLRKARVKTLLISPLKQEEFLDNQPMIDSLIEAGVTIYMMNLATPWDGNSDLQTSQLREIQIEDLLPRDEIQVDLKAVENLLTGKRVMVTGSAGSIGSEMVRLIGTFRPEMMVLVDEAETPQHDIRLMMRKEFPDVKAETIVTTICKKNRMDTIFRQYKPDYVFHAAAYKHVPMMEDNPCEAIENNVEGTRIIADLSVKYGVKKFVMISTDKAVNPTNVMGCSKRICEIYVQSLDKAIKDGKVRGVTQFVTTRFGNVLGSNGSVIPLFKEQIKNGGPVTVTHPDIIRYFMLIPEACKLVLEAGTMGNGGEIFVFDMGKPVKIADLAKRMIQLSGAHNVEIKYTGLRDGEKLFEEVLNDEEVTKPTFNKKIKIATVREYDYKDVCDQIDDLILRSYNFDDMETVGLMKQIVPEYKSQHSKYESLDRENETESADTLNRKNVWL